MTHDDEDTEALRIAAVRELSPPSQGLKSRWQSERSYEFATPEAALVYIACAVAVSMVTGVWPSVELCRERVGVRLGGGEEAGAAQRMTWRELTGWARKLGGRVVEGET